MTGDPDLVGTDWVKSDPRPKGAHSLGWGVCLFVTYRRPNRLIKWAETSYGDGVDLGTGCVPYSPLWVGVSEKTDKKAVFGQKGAEFGHDP